MIDAIYNFNQGVVEFFLFLKLLTSKASPIKWINVIQLPKLNQLLSGNLFRVVVNSNYIFVRNINSTEIAIALLSFNET